MSASITGLGDPPITEISQPFIRMRRCASPLLHAPLLSSLVGTKQYGYASHLSWQLKGRYRSLSWLTLEAPLESSMKHASIDSGIRCGHWHAPSHHLQIMNSQGIIQVCTYGVYYHGVKAHGDGELFGAIVENCLLYAYT